MKKLTMFLGVLGVVMVTPLAHANYTISYQVGAGPTVQCASGPGDIFAQCAPVITSGAVTITGLNGNSNSPGGPPFGDANQAGATANVIATAPAVVRFWFSAPNFTFPTAPPGSIDWSANLQFTSSSAGGAGKIDLRNCVDKANGNTPGGPVGQTGFCTNGLLLDDDTLNFSGISTPPLDTVHANIASLAAPYALQQQVTLVFTKAGRINFITSQVLAPVPEPTSILLLGGVLLITAGAIRRKRNQVSQG